MQEQQQEHTQTNSIDNFIYERKCMQRGNFFQCFKKRKRSLIYSHMKQGTRLFRKTRFFQNIVSFGKSNDFSEGKPFGKVTTFRKDYRYT